jgi:hypothetical protein
VVGAGVAQPLAAAGPHLPQAAFGVGEHPQGVVGGNGPRVMVVEIEECQSMTGGLFEIERVQRVLEVWVIVYSVAGPAERLLVVVVLAVVGVVTEVDFVSVVSAASVAGIVLVAVVGAVVDTAACTAVAVAFVVAGAAASVIVEKE